MFCFLTGYCSIYKKRVWQKVQSYLALHSWAELWFLCHPWNQTFHLFLFGAGGYLTFQVWLGFNWLEPNHPTNTHFTRFYTHKSDPSHDVTPTGLLLQPHIAHLFFFCHLACPPLNIHNTLLRKMLQTHKTKISIGTCGLM